MPWGKFAIYNLLGGTVWAAAAVSLGYFLWASVSLVEHWVGRVSLLLVAALALTLLLRWTYRRATRRDDPAAVRSVPTSECRERL
jgi:membrane protein DedA with SNARE-associated domain